MIWRRIDWKRSRRVGRMPVSTRGGCTPSFFADAGEIHDQLGYRHEAVVPSDGQPAEVPGPEVGSVCRVAFHFHRKTSERAEFWSKRALTASGGVGLSGHGKQGEKTPAYKLAGFLSASDLILCMLRVAPMQQGHLRTACYAACWVCSVGSQATEYRSL